MFSGFNYRPENSLG